MITGVNHVTLVTADLTSALAFWQGTLGGRLRAEWSTGAYLDLGGLWLCLELGRPDPGTDDSHLALTVPAESFNAVAARVAAQAPLWKQNRSEGASLYITDPDGHKVELHVGDLASRLAAYAGRADVTIYP